ncbi:MAG: T9SS type A sorting domain-containing protein [Oculatellaceae cyanobacterium Prado106]|nr:T9SS type A sorting domain-containing protein [Oculatellaceae cyanobacterium Prado106]
MAKDFGKNRNQATVVTVSNAPRVLRNAIGGKDRADFLRFTLPVSSSFQANLSKLKANADLALLNSAGQVIGQSKRKGKRNEAITLPLQAGSYFLRITPGNAQDQTKYRLRLLAVPTVPAVPTNTAPLLATNSPLSLPKGTTAIFNGTQLKATDLEQNPSQLTYTVTRLPESGLLQLSGTRLAVGNTFTQTDIDTGRLSYSGLGRNQRLTNNNEFDTAPQVSGLNAVWSGVGGSDRGVDEEIFFFNGTTVTQLTTNGTLDLEPQISGNNVVWFGAGGSDGGVDEEIFFFNGTTVTQLTTNNTGEFYPQVSGNNIVWLGIGGSDGGTDTELFFFNGTTVTQLTSNSNDDGFPEISGSNITWSSVGGSDGGTDTELFFFNGTTVTQLTTNNTPDINSRISGNNVVWYGRGGSDGGADNEIFFFNGSTVTQLTTNNTDDIDPQISGNNVVWAGRGGSDGGVDTEIFFFNGAIVTQLTTNNTFDSRPEISGTNIAWFGAGGSDGGTDTEIFFFNGSTVSQLTSNMFDDFPVQISGSNLIWRSFFSSGNPEIFLSNMATNDSFGFTLADGAGGVTNGMFNLNLV